MSPSPVRALLIELRPSLSSWERRLGHLPLERAYRLGVQRALDVDEGLMSSLIRLEPMAGFYDGPRRARWIPNQWARKEWVSIALLAARRRAAGWCQSRREIRGVSAVPAIRHCRAEHCPPSAA